MFSLKVSLHTVFAMLLLLWYAWASKEHNITISPSPSCPSNYESCMTLETFSKTAGQYCESYTSLTLHLLPGNHGISSHLIVQNVSELKLYSMDEDVNINCSLLAHFTIINVHEVYLAHLTFHHCGVHNLSRVDAALKISFSSVVIEACIFNNSTGWCIAAHNSTITLSKCVFRESQHGIISGNFSTITDTDSVYNDNKDALLDLVSSSASFRALKFHRNGHRNDHRLLTQSCIDIINTNITFHQSELVNNTAYFSVIDADKNSIIKLEGCLLERNRVFHNSVISVWYSNLTMTNTVLVKNYAMRYHVLYFRSGTIEINNYTVIKQNQAGGYTLVFRESKVDIRGVLFFNSNNGTLLTISSEVTFFNAAYFQGCSTSTRYSACGAVKSIGSAVKFLDPISFRDNYSGTHGGALCALASAVYVRKEIVITGNSAYTDGGGIYLRTSRFTCESNCTFSNNSALNGNGGAIYATQHSQVSLGRDCRVLCASSLPPVILKIISNNSTNYGGGVYFEYNSQMYGPKNTFQKCTMLFEDNLALKGEALYINDDTYSTTCSEDHTLCFLQVSFFRMLLNDKIMLGGNGTKTTLFGGQLDKCGVNALSESATQFLTGISYLQTVTNDQSISKLITSDPVTVCHCNMTNDMCCESDNRTPLRINVQRGKLFTVAVMALDQVSDPVNASIHSWLNNKESNLEKHQDMQLIQDKCTYLSFNIYSPKNAETLTIDVTPEPKRQCKKKNSIKVNVTFKPCTCPLGFEVSAENITDCQCKCDSKIIPYVKNCGISTAVTETNNRPWISYDNSTGFLIHPFCPHDYCLPPTTIVSINLHHPNGSDAQCANGRSDLLCGKCKPGLSLSLGSTHCIQCPEQQWLWAFLIVFGKFTGGLLLLAIILMLDLTVSIGTLNGLIFYANTLGVISTVLLKFSTPTFCSVFIAWLNLDIGFDTCFFKGMDAYAKTWLQFVFPVYVMLVLILITLISKYSSRFGKLIGRWNPVATLATLLLLSFTKLLQVSIDILSFTTVEYPNGQHVMVWLSDATIRYFEVKHLPLCVAAVTIVSVGLVYTVLLFSWQWLLQTPNKWIFRWIRNSRLNLFMEANLAPYNPKYRYWTGLLLFVRIALYLGISADKSHESQRIILLIGLIAASILLVRAFLSNNVYRKRFVGYIAVAFYFNLLTLCIVTLYCQNSDNCQIISSKVSISAAFILFIFIILYHISLTSVKFTCLKKLKASTMGKLQMKNLDHNLIQDPSSNEKIASPALPTSTEVSLSLETNTQSGGFLDEDGIKRKCNRRNTYLNRLREPLLQD